MSAEANQLPAHSPEAEVSGLYHAARTAMLGGAITGPAATSFGEAVLCLERTLAHLRAQRLAETPQEGGCFGVRK